MSSRGEHPVAAAPPRGRCRCGHLPTHHMVVVAVGASASFRLDPSGPCLICGEAGCRQFQQAPG